MVLPPYHQWNGITASSGGSPTNSSSNNTHIVLKWPTINNGSAVSVTYSIYVSDPTPIFGVTFNITVPYTYSTYYPNSGVREIKNVTSQVSYKINTPPTLKNDIYYVTAPMYFDVSANDSDVDSNLNRNSLAILSAPAVGSAGIKQLNPDVLAYETPLGGYVGNTTIVYRLCDTLQTGSDYVFCSNATVLLVINVTVLEDPTGIVTLTFDPIQDLGVQNCWSASTVNGDYLYTHPKDSGSCAYSVLEWDFHCYHEFLQWLVTADLDLYPQPFVNGTPTATSSCMQAYDFLHLHPSSIFLSSSSS